MWLQISFLWGQFFLCREYIVGMGARAGWALLRDVVIGSMKFSDFLDSS